MSITATTKLPEPVLVSHAVGAEIFAIPYSDEYCVSFGVRFTWIVMSGSAKLTPGIVLYSVTASATSIPEVSVTL